MSTTLDFAIFGAVMTAITILIYGIQARIQFLQLEHGKRKEATKSVSFIIALFLILGGCITAIIYIMTENKVIAGKSETDSKFNIQPKDSVWVYHVKDYQPGAYFAPEIPGSLAIIQALNQRVEQSGFTKGMFDTIQVELVVTGNADKIPYRKRILYDGKMGSIFSQCYYEKDQLYVNSIDFSVGKTTMDNAKLCILRAASLITELKKQVELFSDVHFCVNVNINELEAGSDFRGVDAVFNFKPKWKNNFN